MNGASQHARHDVSGANLGRKIVLAACFVLLVTGESAYFLRRSAAAIVRLSARRAFFENDRPTAWRRYQRAVAWGGPRDELDIDRVELLLFGLDQEAAGIPLRPAVPGSGVVTAGIDLIGHRIAEAPHDAHAWSLASDLYGHADRLRRRATPIDLTTLSEDPEANLLPERWLSVLTLERATQLEPNNYIYYDLLADMFLELGLTDRALQTVRRALTAYPITDGRPFLARADLEPTVREAALLGLDDAVRAPSLVSHARIRREAAKLLTRHSPERAADYLLAALKEAPDFYDARAELGHAYLRLRKFDEAVVHFRSAIALEPERPWSHFQLGVAYRAQGNVSAALSAFTRAREIAPGEIRFFHALAETLEESGRFDEAARQFRAAAQLHPQDALAWSTLLAFHHRRADWRSAREVCAGLEGTESLRQLFQRNCASIMEGR